MIEKILKRLFGYLGYVLIKKKDKSTVTKNTVVNTTVSMAFTMKGALERTKKRGLDIKTVIDIGASDGRWSRECLKIYNNATYLLIEAQRGHEPSLEKFKSENSQVAYALAAAGKSKGTIYFDASDLFGGVASETPIPENCIEVPVISVDDEVERLKLQSPYMLKLDTHGFEIPILEGAKNVVKEANLIIIECYNFQLTDSSLKYWEMCAYMEKLGFLPVENVDLMLRSKDSSFWQMDIFFIKKNSKVFASNEYA